MKTIPTRRSTVGAACSALAFAAVIAGCARVQPGSGDGEEGAGAALMRNLLLAPAVDVIAPAGPIEERCALIAGAARLEGDLPLHVFTHAEESARDHPRVVIGTTGSAEVAVLAARLGVGLSGGMRAPGAPGEAGTAETAARFMYLGQLFDAPDDTLIATFEDPDRPGLPVTLFLGNDAARLLLDVVEPLYAWQPNVRVFRSGEIALEAPLSITGLCQLERVTRPAQRRAELRRAYLPLATRTATFTGLCAPEVDAARARTYCDACAQASTRAAHIAAPERDRDDTELVLHARIEDFADWTGSRDFAWLDRHTGTVHALLAPRPVVAGGEDARSVRDAPDDGGAAVALGTLCARLGDPVEPWLADGLAAHCADRYLGRELERWIGWIVASGDALPLETVVERRSSRRHSPHVLVPLRAALARHLLETRGDAYVRELWRGTRRLAIDPVLAASFQAWLAVRADSVRAEHDAPFAAEPPALQRPLFGVLVSEPTFVDHDGFGTRSCSQSLALARAAGSSALGFTTFFEAAADAPAFAGPGGSPRCGAREGDAALLVALADARARGAATMLFPQLLSAPGGTWSGTWLRNGETEWRLFFGDYRRFAVHYALLAELAGCDVLSLGSGLLETTRDTIEGRRGRAEELDWKNAGWASVIRAARTSFHGRLTFVAGSGEEVLKIDFWDDLDFVGLEPRVVFRPARGMQMRDARLQFAGFLQATWHAAERVARERKKRLLVTGVSFPAAAAPDSARLGPGSSSRSPRDEAFSRVARLAHGSGDLVEALLLARWSTAETRGANERDHELTRPEDEDLVRDTLFTARTGLRTPSGASDTPPDATEDTQTPVGDPHKR